MTILQKRFALAAIFLAIFLVWSGISSAEVGPVFYSAENGEQKIIGQGFWNCCRWDVSGKTPYCVSSCTQYSCGISWYEYRVESTQCGATILRRQNQSVCGTGEKCCGCGLCRVEYGRAETYKRCGKWQKAERDIDVTKWGITEPQCQCEGECLAVPENDRYYNDPTYSDKPEKNLGNAGIKLPVKLDWDDVEGWGQDDGPLSYSMAITTSTVATSTGPLLKSEYIPRACLLPSNKTSKWQVSACCNIDGTNCGKASDWEIKTNSAPELIAPADPDWVGSAGATNTALPASLDWCDVKEANSLLLKVYILEGGNKICHPNLLSIKGGREFCDSEVLRKKRRDPQQLERMLYSDFLDEDLSFFTQDTTYLWEVATCIDDSGLDCKDSSQQWTFTTGKGTSPKTFLTSPTNDPSGQKPVGLPLVLDWRKDAGVNSWRYRIDSTEQLTTASQSQPFDYPELSLDAFYQWQVLSCFDYEGEKCQNAWSEVFTFKTTGQPPNLTFPASGAADIPFPINFSWSNVSGAESYIINIKGDGLDIKKTLTESNFSADFPEFPLKQETNYTWQVKTCAQRDGKVCGVFSNPQNFRTFRISSPQGPTYPQGGGMLFTDERFLSWGKTAGAKAYLYQVKYLSPAKEESDSSCQALAGKEIFPEPQKTLTSSGFVELTCLGEYQWQVRSCLDEECKQTSDWSSPQTFTFLEGGKGKGGLVPCGRTSNNDNTPWNEREPCQIKHLFLSIKIILDFLLLKLMPMVLGLLAVATGVIFYTSFGQAVTMAQVMSLWKGAIIGLGLILFAWAIINLFLGLVGYNIGIFGNWHSL